MQYEYFNKSSTTSLVTTVAFLAVSIIPSSNYEIPEQSSTNYQDYAQIAKENIAKTISQKSNEQAKILLSFADKLGTGIKDLDNDIAHIIHNNFWEMYDRF